MDEIKRYRLLIGGAVLLAMIGLAWYAVTKNTGDTPVAESTSTPTLPEIDRDAITQLEVQRPEDDHPIRLVKDGDHWRLTAPIEAPAAATAIDTALDKLADLELRGVAATRSQHHERLEVDAEHGVHVIARAGDREVINFWIGAVRSGNTMIRLDGQDPVLMAHGSFKFAFNKAVRDWRDRAITDIDPDTVREVTFTNTNGTFHFTKNGEEWAQATDPAAEGQAPAPAIERFASSKVRTSVTSIARLRASDFAADDVTAESAGIASGARVTFVSGEGESATTTTLLVGNEVEEGSRYVQREGSDTIFVVSRFVAERLVPNAAAFQESEQGAAPAPGGAPEGMPGGMPGGGGQIPPELMRQIQQQLQQQGLGGDGHGH